MITDITRSYIKMIIGDKTITSKGEAFLPGHGSPDFVVYEDLIRNWDAPYDAIKIDEAAKSEILRVLRLEMKKRNMTIEIE